MSANILLCISLFLIASGSFFLVFFRVFTCKNLGFSFLGSGLVMLPVAVWLHFL